MAALVVIAPFGRVFQDSVRLGVVFVSRLGWRVEGLFLDVGSRSKGNDVTYKTTAPLEG